MRRGLLLGLLVGVLGCWGKSPPEPVPIGHIVPLNGPGEFAGERARRGVQLALEDLNKEETRGERRPLQVQHADARLASATATRLVKIDRVAALLDASDPGQCQAVADVADTAETLLLTTSPLTRPPKNESVFSLTASPSYQGTVLARFAREELKLASVVVLSDRRIPACAAIVDGFAREFTKAGGKVGPASTAFAGDDELAERVVQIKKQSSPLEAVLFSGTAAHFSRTAALVHQASPTTPVLFAGDEGALLALSVAPVAGPVHLTTVYHASGLTTTEQQTAAAYQSRFGQELDVHAALAVEGVRWLAEALGRSKNGPTSMRKEIPGIEDFAGLTGPLSFTKEGCCRRPVFVLTLEPGRETKVKRYEAEPTEPK